MFYFILFFYLFFYVLEVLKKNYGEMIMAETLTSKVFI